MNRKILDIKKISIIAIITLMCFSGISQTLAAQSESGYRVAIRRQEMIQYLIWPIPFHHEQILWFNMDAATANAVLMGGNGWMDVISALLQLRGGLEPVTLFISLIVLAERALIRASGFQRPLGDVKFGIGFTIIPIGGYMNLWIDYGNDGYGIDGIISIPQGLVPVNIAAPFILGICVTDSYWFPIYY